MPSVLPADAGVFRSRCSSGPPSVGPPRRRGGVPVGIAPCSVVVTSSPPTRGCSAAARRLSALVLVLPADAGVFRPHRRRPDRRRRPPRRCGGVPDGDTSVIGRAESSPPTRGCSAVLVGDHCGCYVIPADAGVFRAGGRRARPRRRPPLRRRGVPSAPPGSRSPARCSPPTRGCSVVAVVLHVDAGVLPADAGVFRVSELLRAGSRRAPRRRGGVLQRTTWWRPARPSSDEDEAEVVALEDTAIDCPDEQVTYDPPRAELGLGRGGPPGVCPAAGEGGGQPW